MCTNVPKAPGEVLKIPTLAPATVTCEPCSLPLHTRIGEKIPTLGPKAKTAARALQWDGGTVATWGQDLRGAWPQVQGVSRDGKKINSRPQQSQEVSGGLKKQHIYTYIYNMYIYNVYIHTYIYI